MKTEYVREVRVYISASFDPWFNLAVENWLLRFLPVDTRVLFLYRNCDSVVIGRYQNPWVECDALRVKQEGIVLCRRQSGGGTVFHDKGNCNYAFLGPRNGFDKGRNAGVVLRALRGLGVPVSLSKRYDLFVEDRKVSGCAFKFTKDRILHHGTLLVSSDLSRLGGCLRSPWVGIESKGIGSVRSPVVNLDNFMTGLDCETVFRVVQDEFREVFGGGRWGCEVVRQNDWLAVEEVREYYDFCRGWEWVFGNTPSFRQRVVIAGKEGCGGDGTRVLVEARRGIVTEACFAGPGDWTGEDEVDVVRPVGFVGPIGLWVGRRFDELMGAWVKVG